MAKDPAILFYPNDYIGGTMGMTFEEKGAYMELLMMQFNRGHMTEHMIGQTVGQLWDKIQDKFIKDENGLYFNKRFEDEKIKRQKFTDSRYNNRKGVNQYSKKDKKTVGHMTTHMENENRNEDINKREENFKIKIFEFKDKYNETLLEEFFNHFSQHGENDKKMLFEKQRSWELSKRLVTWYNKSLQFKKSKTHIQHDSDF